MGTRSISGVMWVFLAMVGVGCGDHAMQSTASGRSLASSTVSRLAPAEGMWLFNALPVERLRSEFSFDPGAAWVENLRLASVRVGASGAFVSPDGLVLTNHHVAVRALQNISRPGKDYVANGFLARSRDEEAKLAGMELSVLESIEDVTARVNAAVDPRLPPEQAVKARHAVFADIERESLQKTGLHSNVITLYGGALYHLYRYHRYTDVRAVFAPEVSAAFFGGDPDNFEYPRYDLDIALLRAYENGKPAHVEHFLKISSTGVSAGDLVFVSGHPGRTDRLLPVIALQSLRDFDLPLRIKAMEGQERALVAYSKRGPEAERQAREDIFGVENGLKATRPRLAALQGDLISRKAAEEKALREQLRSHSELRHYDVAWDRMAAVERRRRELLLPFQMIEEGRAFSTQLFYFARELVRLPAEDAKPDDQRLPEFTQAKRQPLEHRLLADNPIYPELEIVKLTQSLTHFRDTLGAESAFVQRVLDGQEPAARARELVGGTKLAAAGERRRIRDGGADAIQSSSDSMVRLAKLLDDDARQLRKSYESEVEEPEREALTQINRARFALLGTTTYPDATGTLRLAFGIVKEYRQDGQTIAPWTTIGGAFAHEQRHGGKPPYQLPATWHAAQGQLDSATPLNFVSTADITGGNSGSPVVNRAGELVGVVFDSNRQGVANDFAYTDEQARAVCVDSRGILQALKNIYHADALVTELTHPGGGQ